MLTWHGRGSGVEGVREPKSKKSQGVQTMQGWKDAPQRGILAAAALQESGDHPFEYLWEAEGKLLCSSAAGSCLSVWFLAPDLAALI